MNNQRWLTKEDILNDLEEVTGKRVTNIDDRFAVRGEQPPPVHVPDEDEDEFVQMYGGYANRDSNSAEPDLFGITHMLRMVNDYYDRATYDDNENIKELMKTANAMVHISKLNPNTPEFVPKKSENVETETKDVINGIPSKSKSSDCLETEKSSSKTIDIKNLDYKNDDEVNKTGASHRNETNNNDIDVTKKIDVSSLNSNDLKDIREKLKLKIVGTSKAECFVKKRERNLAMASLLKLYTDIPKSSKIHSPPKLITPEYFENLPEDGLSKVGDEPKRNIIEEEIHKENVEKIVKPVLKTTHPPNESFSSPGTTSQESSDLSSNKTSDANTEKHFNGLVMSKEVEESVKKVDKWLNGSEKKKQKFRAVCFGPVTFKRKETCSVNSSETPSIPIIDNIESASSARTSDSFVPSAYANELVKTYTERTQSVEIQKEDIWTILEKKLREKDKVIKERLSKQTQN